MTAPQHLIDRTVHDVPLTDLRHYNGNARRGNVAQIRVSLLQHGQYRPIIVRRETNEVLAGNHTLKAAKDLGWDTIAVTYLDNLTDAQARKIVLMDNKSNDMATYDDEALITLLNDLDGDFIGSGFQQDDLDALVEGLAADLAAQNSGTGTHEDSEYTKKIKAPSYEPQMDAAPPVASLFDTTKTNDLQSQIAAADLPDDVRQFLTIAAARHVVFRYDRIAEFYAHADAATQRLMEASALVIIDMDDAIANGFVRLSTRLDALLNADRDDETERQAA